MTYQEALIILKNPKDNTAEKLKEAIEVVKSQMFGR